jgi:hypothetical protein
MLHAGRRQQGSKIVKHEKRTSTAGIEPARAEPNNMLHAYTQRYDYLLASPGIYLPQCMSN